MSFISNSYLDELRSRLSIVEVVKATVKLGRKGKDWWGCCPFHHEKTPSFTVSDEKGSYHCFGCSEHGDAISFEMKANHLSFVEAVEKLSAIAGMEMPKPSTVDIEKERKRLTLFDVVEKACLYFESMLYLSSGSQALNYIKKRGISDKTIKAFRLGYAPSGNGLREHLKSLGITVEQMIQVGLCSKKDDKIYDYFRDRLIFPIADRRGKIIAFGGRIMGEGEPKYLNSPESDLFHKSQVLYAYDKAKTNARKHNSIIAVEGYMDVIALYQAGIDYAVAPLGTALTELQIQSLWQVANEPILCFDGDSAGRKASMRAVPRVLPILKEGYSLKFMWLPEGQDPDDIIRTVGGESFLDMLKTATPLVDVVEKIVITEKDLTTPEKKAKIESKIKEIAATIQNESIRKFYTQELNDKLYNKTFGKRFNKGKNKQSQLISDRKLLIDDEKLKTLIAYILCYPEVTNNFVEQIALVESQNKFLNNKLRDFLDMLADSFDEIANANKQDFALNIEMLQRKYKKIEYPEPLISNDIDKELKSLALVGIINDIRRIESELIQEPDMEKLVTLKNLIAEKISIEGELEL